MRTHLITRHVLANITFRAGCGRETILTATFDIGEVLEREMSAAWQLTSCPLELASRARGRIPDARKQEGRGDAILLRME